MEAKNYGWKLGENNHGGKKITEVVCVKIWRS